MDQTQPSPQSQEQPAAEGVDRWFEELVTDDGFEDRRRLAETLGYDLTDAEQAEQFEQITGLLSGGMGDQLSSSVLTAISTEDRLETAAILAEYIEQMTGTARRLAFHAIRQVAAVEYRHHNDVDFDHLTGALSRRGFERWLTSYYGIGLTTEQRQSRFNEERELAYFSIDLCNFKKINDKLGHHIGDELLIEAVAELRYRTRMDDNVQIIRLGGDELAIAAPKMTETDARGLRKRLHEVQRNRLKDDIHTRKWQRILDMKGSDDLVEVRTVVDETFGDELAEPRRVIFVGGKSSEVELGDLVVMALGLSHGVPKTQADIETMQVAAEKPMAELKRQYHTLMGGAYR